MTDEQIAFSIKQMKEFGIVDSGDTDKLGIGAMTDARMQSFYDKMVKAKVLPGRHRHQEGLHARVRQQGRRPRPEEVTGSAGWRDAEAATRTSGSLLLALRDVGKVFSNGTTALDATSTSTIARRRFPQPARPVGLRQVDGAAAHRRPVDADRGQHRLAAAASDPAADIGFVFQEPTLMPWASVFDNVWLPLGCSGVSRAQGRAGGRRQLLDMVGPDRLRERRIRASFGRHEDARLDRPRAGHQAAACC